MKITFEEWNKTHDALANKCILVCKDRLRMWEMAVPMPLCPCVSLFIVFSLPSYIWVSRHRWVWGFRPVQARRSVCEHLWKLRMLLYGWILPREWAWTFPPGQRHHVMHRWVSAKEGSFLKVGFCSQMTFFCWEPVSVGPVLGMWVEIICSFAHLYNLLNKVNITGQKGWLS